MSEECDRGECCIRRSLYRGKRQVTTPTCQRLGHTGEKCYPGENYHKWVAFLGACPCLSGLCKNSTFKEVPDNRFVGQCSPSPAMYVMESAGPIGINEQDDHRDSRQPLGQINRFQNSFSQKAKLIRKIIQLSRASSKFPKKWSAM
ncbi:uncharacterized protein LOC121390528 [Gigantopelta aegis]|uniref:uncharacterized protein LOC121390528 n=1 Tax=Gigantopelta aegis TaxID=1735272 RepID=UPI001B8898ED|nr:uncharacterized protein LOC121390528 [Gigantopelta aegis]